MLTKHEKKLIANYLDISVETLEFYWDKDESTHLFYLDVLERAREDELYNE